jgi:hypothetical protein
MDSIGARRVLQPVRQPLSEKNRRIRLEFARNFADLTGEEWEKWIWTDETWVNGLGSGRRWVTVFAGEDPQKFSKVRMRANGGCFGGALLVIEKGRV